MAEAKVLRLIPGGQPDSARALRREPMADRLADRFPIWVHVSDSTKVPRLLRDIRTGLVKNKGVFCDSDIQTDPHEGLKIEGFFEVFQTVGEKRAPEHLGIVTCYSDAEGRLAIKMNPSFPEACDLFRDALAGAQEGLIASTAGTAGAGGKDIEIIIRQQDRYEAPDFRNGAGNGPSVA